MNTNPGECHAFLSPNTQRVILIASSLSEKLLRIILDSYQ